jgi:alpha/beta superfamily hydrolase
MQPSLGLPDSSRNNRATLIIINKTISDVTETSTYTKEKKVTLLEYRHSDDEDAEHFFLAFLHLLKASCNPVVREGCIWELSFKLC